MLRKVVKRNHVKMLILKPEKAKERHKMLPKRLLFEEIVGDSDILFSKELIIKYKRKC